MTDKNSVADWSTTATDNDNIAGVPLAENLMYPRHVNNALRTMMAQIASAGFVGTADLAVVATSGAYSDLTGTPTIASQAEAQAGTDDAAGMTALKVKQEAGVFARLPPQGRLTLTSGVPVLSSDVTSATTIYYTPFVGDICPVYDGTAFVPVVFAELSLALDGTSSDTGYHQVGKNFDLFVINDSGTPRLATGPAWSSDTSRGTGAGTTELQRLNGLLTNKNSMTVRFGAASGNTLTAAAGQATFVGSFRTSGNGSTQVQFGGIAVGASAGFIGLCNAYNRRPFRCFSGDSTDTWTYAVAAWRAANNSSGIRCSFLSALGDYDVSAEYAVPADTSATTSGYVGVKLDATTGYDGRSGYVFSVSAGSRAQAVARADYQPSVGWHFVTATENSDGTAQVTFRGDNGLAANLQSGLSVVGSY